MHLVLSELNKLWHIQALRVSLFLLLCFPFIWSFAPGVGKVYGFFIVSAYQVPAFALISSMDFLLPLLVAIAGAALIGLEINHHTLPTVLLRPISRSQWLFAKMLVAALYPFIVLLLMLLVSLLAGAPHGYGSFLGSTGFGDGDLVGVGRMSATTAMLELGRAYLVAALTLVPISLLALTFAIIFRNGSSGALATIAVLVFMRLLLVFPALERFLLTSYLDMYNAPIQGWLWLFTLLAYTMLAAVVAMIIFERRDF